MFRCQDAIFKNITNPAMVHLGILATFYLILAKMGAHVLPTPVLEWCRNPILREISGHRAISYFDEPETIFKLALALFLQSCMQEIRQCQSTIVRPRLRRKENMSDLEWEHTLSPWI